MQAGHLEEVEHVRHRLAAAAREEVAHELAVQERHVVATRLAGEHASSSLRHGRLERVDVRGAHEHPVGVEEVGEVGGCLGVPVHRPSLALRGARSWSVLRRRRSSPIIQSPMARR